MPFSPSSLKGPTAQIADRPLNPIIPILALLTTATLWSLGGALIKLANDGGAGLSPLVITCYRALLAGIFFLPQALRRRATLQHASKPWIAASVLSFTLLTITFVAATTRTAAANAILLQYTSPFWVFLLSPLILKEHPRRSEALVLCVALAGVLVIFLGHPTGGAGALTLALVSGFGFGLLTIIFRKLKQIDAGVLVCLNCLGSGAILLGALLGSAPSAPNERQWALILLLAILQFSIPYALFAWALRHVQAYQASLIVLLEAILNPVWTYLLTGEPVPHATLIGGPLILGSVAAWILLTARAAASTTG